METTPDHPRLLHRLSLAQVRIALIIICFSLLFGCVQSGSVPMGNRYAAVNPQSVQILFQPPPWRYEQIGIVTCLGAQAASDAIGLSRVTTSSSRTWCRCSPRDFIATCYS